MRTFVILSAIFALSNAWGYGGFGGQQQQQQQVGISLSTLNI
jgi:hypothetical protein